MFHVLHLSRTALSTDPTPSNQPTSLSPPSAQLCHLLASSGLSFLETSMHLASLPPSIRLLITSNFGLPCASSIYASFTSRRAQSHNIRLTSFTDTPSSFSTISLDHPNVSKLHIKSSSHLAVIFPCLQYYHSNHPYIYSPLPAHMHVFPELWWIGQNNPLCSGRHALLHKVVTVPLANFQATTCYNFADVIPQCNGAWCAYHIDQLKPGLYLPCDAWLHAFTRAN